MKPLIELSFEGKNVQGISKEERAAHAGAHVHELTATGMRGGAPNSGNSNSRNSNSGNSGPYKRK